MTLTAEPKTTDTPQIYIACLAAYNNGILHGKWIEVSDDIDDIKEAIRNVLDSSPIPDAEEWAIHDFEGFGEVRLDEGENIERVHELSCFLQEHNEIGALALDHYNGDVQDAESALEAYQGSFTSLTAYAEETTEGTAEIPQHLQFYIDYERMGKDMEMSGDIFSIETGFGEVHVFLNQ